MINNNLFMSKITDNKDTISIEEYIPIMKMILSEEEFYIVCKMNNIRIEENESYSHHFKELSELNGQAKKYKLKQLSIIEGRAINKLKIGYKINNSFIITKDELKAYYNKEIDTINNDIDTVENLRMGEIKNLSIYKFPFSVFSYHEDNQELTYDKKPYYLKQLSFCKSYYINKINNLNSKKKELKK